MNEKYFQIIFSLILFFILQFELVGCANSDVCAPVTEIATIESLPKKGYHIIKKGESLYSTAWRYGLDYRFIARRNHIAEPYAVHPGDKIYLTGHAPPVVKSHKPQPIKKSIKQPVAVVIHEPTASVKNWHWPARGPLIAKFSELNKGIDIAGKEGDPIYATAPGKVVYSGDGLRNYGNLIIIKHNSQYLSSYAHNRLILVKEGDWVKDGQKIAEMGKTGTRRVMLYFEIRRSGKPMNPLSYLRF